MSRNKALAALQKTYDESYLSCSTAVYHESQGNELEAMRHWRGALEHIYDHNANKSLPPSSSRSDTERALMDALKQLELQCKERIDLLEALRVSRQEGAESVSRSKLSKEPESHESSSSRLRGSIGEGTIPAVTYSELSRPTLPPRPPPAGRKSSDPSIRSYSSHRTITVGDEPNLSAPERSQAKGQDDRSRGPSPDKYTMRTTLRSGKSGDKLSKPSRKAARPAGEGPSKAATLAWSALGSRERSARGSPSNGPSVTQQPPPRRSAEQPRMSGTSPLQWDSHSRRLITSRDNGLSVNDGESPNLARHSDEYSYSRPSLLSVSAASSALNSSSTYELSSTEHSSGRQDRYQESRLAAQMSGQTLGASQSEPQSDVGGGSEGHRSSSKKDPADLLVRRKPPAKGPGASPRAPRTSSDHMERPRRRERQQTSKAAETSSSGDDSPAPTTQARQKKPRASEVTKSSSPDSSDGTLDDESSKENAAWAKKKASILKNLPSGVDETAAKQILNDIVVKGDEVHWSDIAGLEVAKNALREAVVYPFLRPDLFMGLREPARGMLLFGPPGTGKTMLARAVATESRSTFFSISASSLTSKFLGESEKLVRALFGLARSLSPSIIFVDEIDSLLSQRSGSGEHEATRRIKTEFLIQWSDLQRAAAGREISEKDQGRGDANRVLVLAATNLPWAIDEAARRRFVRRQYIPLPESTTRETQLRTLLGQQKHDLSDKDIQSLVGLTEGFSGSDITALAKDAAMGPLRSLGEALLHMTMDDIRPIMLIDFEVSLRAIRPSVSKTGLQEYEDWAREFGERGG